MVPTILVLTLVCIYATRAEVATQFKELLVGKHNELRGRQGASDMNELVWNDTLAKIADNWVSKCNFAHEMKGYGENLAYNTGKDEVANINTALNNWYDEIKLYYYGGKACGSACHYTQLVWAHTRQVGCATKRCDWLNAFGSMKKDGWMIGCWYTPKGNDISEYPFHKGSACSECLEGQTCEDDLCIGEGKEICEDKNENCEEWEGRGECDSNPDYMQKECRMSCGICKGGAPKPCVDKSADCERYGKTYCSTNADWMKANCKKLCGLCTE